MKLSKLEPPIYDSKIVDKINEIIELLNNSFITQDPDIVYREVTDFGSISCDRLTPLVNEITQPNPLDRQIKGVYDGITCPACGATRFMIGPSSVTCVYYPPVIQDGVNINPDRNKTTTSYTCSDCGNTWKETE